MPPPPERQAVILLKRITGAAPGTTIAYESRSHLEHTLMSLLKAGGLRAVEQLMRRAGATTGIPITIFAKPRGGRSWNAVVPRRGELHVTVLSLPGFKSTSVQWTALRKPLELSAREQKRAEIQDAFYARYMAAVERVYATPPQRISADDRRILLVGEFEADVNNGGFSQYLFNKGRSTARTTASILADIGAAKTAALLNRALSTSDEATWHALDNQFQRDAEDLPSMSMRAIKTKAARK